MVYRIYVEKKKTEAHEAKALLRDLRNFVGLKEVEDVRIVNRYDVSGIEKKLFDKAINTVFSEPQLDDTGDTLDLKDGVAFAVEYLPGQFDQRADSAAQCIQIISKGERPVVRTAKVYILSGNITDEVLERVKKYVINPVECREAGLETVDSLENVTEEPADVEVLQGFCELDVAGLHNFVVSHGLAMDDADILFLQHYFRDEGRDPTITEIRMVDTYWSDHCRHTTFLTNIDSVEFEDEKIEETYKAYIATRESIGTKKPICLMDLATIAAKALSRAGKLEKLDKSDEINACTVKIKVTVDGEPQDWLLLFKNETHNHPTEIEPFGGAATCIGGAIRDPLSGRSYVYAAMRVTGASDPTGAVEDTLAGKLPQRKLVTTAAQGYSSYGNQIGLATCQVDEIYHEGYVAKHMEIGAVLGAAPQKNVRRECPSPDDVVILLGGRTGRDGIGGATGSSKSHTEASLGSCGAEVQKGNAPEERKLQRLFRNEEAAVLIKRCNDFGAGGVSVAIGELADGLQIDLDKVTKKYEGLDGTELAISESQERMAVVVAPEDAERFMELANSENLEATVVARVTEEPRLTMSWRGKKIVDISREFLNSNGAPKHIDVKVAKPALHTKPLYNSFTEGMKATAEDLLVCSRRGLCERFDSTIGATTVMMPFGGKNQLTPSQAMVNKLPVEIGQTDDVSFLSWGYNPYISEKSSYHGAYLAVVESLSKLVATGGDISEDTYFTYQEYFEKPLRDPKRWGKPMAALLGAFKAQMDFEIASIGGKDSMSGSFEKIDVPPTLVSFAVTVGKTDDVITSEFKAGGHKTVLITPVYEDALMPSPSSQKKVFEAVTRLIREKKAVAVRALGYGGVAEAVFKMAIGNSIGFKFAEGIALDKLFGYGYGSFVVELADGVSTDGYCVLGETVAEESISYGNEALSLDTLLEYYNGKLEKVYPTKAAHSEAVPEVFSYKAPTTYKAKNGAPRPRVLIPVFPGTNCEYDSARAMREAGAEPEIFVINNLTAQGIADSVHKFALSAANSQIIFIPGGFSGGDEPDGSGKFITAFFRNGEISDEVKSLLELRDGLMCGICNGFQALIKLGLVPFGQILDPSVSFPTLAGNIISRHQSRIVRVRVASNKSPWLAGVEVGEVYNVPISHGEGRFLASDELIKTLADNGQIATQYCDAFGKPTMDIDFNPNGSAQAIEGILSPDGRVIGKMGHSERIGNGLYKNVEGNYDMKLFDSAVKYYK
ncbi:MAG: phosphoribosylformylglycinamidine synthase [Clostridia bacterium]|nr:phosphoribosylformylglycinamidine synthase [Clostridia bacterium]